MKRTVTIALLALLGSLTLCQARTPDLPLEFTDSFLDSMSVKQKRTINNYSMIGVHYGYTISSMTFNPNHPQEMTPYPGYMAVYFTHYEKLFDYLPYFGFQIGLERSTEGYDMKASIKTGSYYTFPKEKCKSLKMNVIEVPMMAQVHYDADFFKVFASFGIYGGYRLDIERFGPDVDENYRTKFYDTDVRLDYGLQGGLGFGLVFNPIEIHISAALRYGWSSIFTPDSLYPEGSANAYYNRFYYRFAYPFDIMVSAGVYFHLTKRYGKTTGVLKREAKDIVYGTKAQ